MSGYKDFSLFYDELTSNIDYKKRAQYFDALIEKFGGKKGGILLDLACGTGSLSEEFDKLGYDVIATDSSIQMLSCALNKKAQSGSDIQYLCQDMRNLDMYGTIDVTVCALDSLNHLPKLDDIIKVFERVFLFCEPGGLFIFDVNTVYKHKYILGDNIFTYDMPNVYCVWENEFDEAKNKTNILLNIFEKRGMLYSRYTESFCEYAYEISRLDEALESAGFEIAAHFDYDSFDKPSDKSEKIVFVARKPQHSKC